MEEDLPEGKGEANDMLATSEELEGGRFVPRGLEGQEIESTPNPTAPSHRPPWGRGL